MSTHGGRVQRESDQAPETLAQVGYLGVFVSGKTIIHTVSYAEGDGQVFEVTFADGSALRLVGKFDAMVKHADGRATAVDMGVDLTTGEPDVIELDPADVREE
jgi:hypothetical protein